MTQLLCTTPNLARPDDLYARLIALHHGLTDHESTLANARLILLLANHVGDDAIVAEAIDLAWAHASDTGSQARSGA